MYHFSRSLYRRLAPRVVGAPGDPGGSRARRQLLDACEDLMVRMAEDRRYLAHPARSLFREIRCCFSIQDQVAVRAVVDAYVGMADAYLESLPENVTPFGERRQCRATTKCGDQCRRDPLPGKDYCPSHKHLEEPMYVPAAFDRDRELSAAAL